MSTAQDVRAVLDAHGWSRTKVVSVCSPIDRPCGGCDTDREHPAVAYTCWHVHAEPTEPWYSHEFDEPVCLDAVVPVLERAQQEAGFIRAYIEVAE